MKPSFVRHIIIQLMELFHKHGRQCSLFVNEILAIGFDLFDAILDNFQRSAGKSFKSTCFSNFINFGGITLGKPERQKIRIQIEYLSSVPTLSYLK